MNKRLSAIFMALAIICFSFFAIASSDDDSPAKESGTGGTQSNNTQPSEDVFKLTETAVFSKIKVTANEVKRSMGSEYNEPSDGKIFVGVKFTIENTSAEEQSMSSLLLFEAYADDIKCDYSIGAAMAFDEGTLDGALAAGKKMVGYYAVEVPKDTKTLSLEVAGSWLSSSKATFVIDVPAA